MKTVVITGSARGFGFAMLKLFAREGCSVVVCDVNEESILKAKEELEKVPEVGKVLAYPCDVTNREQLDEMIRKIVKETGKIDIWINNAGVNQPDNYIWDIDTKTVSRLIDINLKGDIYCTQAIMPQFVKQGYGAVYFVEGFGCDGRARPRLSLYGTSKRGVDFFIDALYKDIEEAGFKKIQVGAIVPGIMITNFIHKTLGDGKTIDIPEQTKKVYNILGDYPETIAAYMVPRVLKNEKPFTKITWLTNARAAGRFMTAGFRKRDFFSEK